MNINTIITLMVKEFSYMAKDKLFWLVTTFSFVIFLGFYFAIPSDMGGSEELAIAAEDRIPEFLQILEEHDVEYVLLNSKAELIEAVEAGDYRYGVFISEATWSELKRDRRMEIPIYIRPGTDKEFVGIITASLEILLNDLATRLRGISYPVEIEETVLGRNLLTNEVSAKKIIIPLMVIMILIMEVFGLGYSFMEEKERRTLTAILVAPVRLSELVTAKGLAGVTVIFAQIMICLAITGSLQSQAFLIVILVLLGSFLVIGLSFIVASLSRDLISFVSWAMLLIIVMMVPIFGVIFPGMYSIWIRFIPSFLLAENLNQLINLNATGAEIWFNTVLLAAISLAIFILSVQILKKRIQWL